MAIRDGVTNTFKSWPCSYQTFTFLSFFAFFNNTPNFRTHCFSIWGTCIFSPKMCLKCRLCGASAFSCSFDPHASSMLVERTPPSWGWRPHCILLFLPGNWGTASPYTEEALCTFWPTYTGINYNNEVGCVTLAKQQRVEKRPETVRRWCVCLCVHMTGKRQMCGCMTLQRQTVRARPSLIGRAGGA